MTNLQQSAANAALLEQASGLPSCLEDGTLEQLLEDRIFGRYITSLGYATQPQVKECLRLQGRILERGGKKMRLSDILVARNYLTRVQTDRLNQEFNNASG